MLYVVNYLPEEMSVLFNQPVTVGMAEPEAFEVRQILEANEWQSLINDKKVAETLSLLLGMKIPTATKKPITFKYSDKLIVFLLKQIELLPLKGIEPKNIISYYKFVYVNFRPLSEVLI